jgi:sulfate/thiosulfate transport system substrate-binding protein
MNETSNPGKKAITWRQVLLWTIGAAALLAVVYFGGRALLTDRNGPVRLVVYAFSTQEEVLTQAIFPAFEAAWEAETGRPLTIEGIFGPSATLAGQINLGAPADVAVFSNEQDVTRLKVGGRIDREAQGVVVSYTPMVIATRAGNPAGLADWHDLARPGVRVLHPDPRTSGAGAWGVLGAYGSALLQSGSPATAQQQLEAIWDNVRAMSPSARDALTLFELGAGDALVTYEQDARLAQEQGAPLEIVLPQRTILAQHVAVIVDRNVTRSERPAAQALIDYLLSEAGQEALVRNHWRPALPDGSALLPLQQPFTVQDLGGWPKAYAEVIDGVWQKQIEPRLDVDIVGPLSSRSP